MREIKIEGKKKKVVKPEMINYSYVGEKSTHTA